jgi:hypothetical protein
MLKRRWVLLSTTFRTGRTVSKDALSNAPDDVRDAGRGILKEFERSSPPLSVRACLDARRGGNGCGTLNDVLRLIVGGGSSSSDSVSSSSHSPGYWRRTSCCDGCRTSRGVSSSSTGTVSVRARPVSSMMRRVRGLRTSGMDVSDPPLCLFRGDERRGMLETTTGIEVLESIEDGLLFLNPLSVLLLCSPGFVLSAEPDDEFVFVRECWFFTFIALSISCCASRACVS